MKPNDDPPTPEEGLPNWEAPPPLATPVEEPVPLAEPVAPHFQPDRDADIAVDSPDGKPDQPEADASSLLVEEPSGGAPAAPVEAAIPCPVCGTARRGKESSCGDCGYYFSPGDLAPGNSPPPAGGTGDPPAANLPTSRLKDRFEVRERIGERSGVTRYHGLDHGDGSGAPVPVVIVRQAVTRPPEAIPVEETPVASTGEPAALAAGLGQSPAAAEEDEEVLPHFDEAVPTALPATEILPALPIWPSLDWERLILSSLEHPGLPAVIDRFTEGDFDYLIEEAPTGRTLWDAWDDPESDSEKRFGYLAEVAETLHQLHQCNAILEGLRPEIIVISPDGHARLSDMGELLPFPLPADLALRRLPYTAPEVLAGKADARADLYSFGAMLYALHVGRDLNEIDFDRSGTPKPFIPRFPDIHPAFGRLMSKTFRTDVAGRFPTDEAGREEPTGFVELIRTLRTLGRTLDNVHLEIAAWTTTGMVRTGNEDAFALLHACESRQDDLSETALVLLCDGMGGYEAGEVAAALAIQIMRQYLVQQKPFAPLSGASSFPGDILRQPAAPAKDDQRGHAAPPIDVEEMKKLLKAALKEANKLIYTASRAPGSKRRGMGCTAEVVYIDGRNVVVGHVGDSRTYHFHEGRLIQMTRDQTLVNRLVELGTLTQEEAETHPRRNELQQAIGGQPDVEPGLSQGVLKAGDWVLVCCDGLTNHVSNADLEQMLRGEGYSAETVARRLVNLVNLQGATDNATVVVIRAT